MAWLCQLVNLTSYPSLLWFTICQPHRPPLILRHSCHPSGLGSSDTPLCFGGGLFQETKCGPSHPLPFSPRKLSHPKLVQLYGVCLEQAPICLVFEFMEHGCLSDYLRSQRGLLAAETLLGMCLDVCEGMAYLEEACVIHRDLVRRCTASTFRSRRKGL